MIKVDDLKKYYGPHEAVRGVSFEVAEGEIFGFLGPNGAGKTSTVHMLCTLLTPTGGDATVNGYDVVRQRSHVKRSIGVVFQEATLDEYLTAEQNLKLHYIAYGQPKAEWKKRSDDVLALVDLGSRRKDRVRTFSGGMKRRLEVARGLIHRPKVLFLDEPTLGLDPQSRRRVWEYLEDLRTTEHLTIFLTTHYMDEAEKCDNIAIIDEGRILTVNTPRNLKDGLGGDVITLITDDNEQAARMIEETYKKTPLLLNGSVAFSVTRGEQFLPEFVRTFPGNLVSVGVRQPTLDEVFLSFTGRAIRDE
jgi:ABC-2 type transport system ATP-binding protein